MSSKVDLPSLQMVLVFTINLVVAFIYRSKRPMLQQVGSLLLIASVFFFVYVLYYLKGGFFGSTEPVLNYLVTEGPYRFCRHPLYLCFLLMVLGISFYLGSYVSVMYIILFSLPSTIYRARIEDKLLNRRFGKEWQMYAKHVGMFYPKRI